MYKKGNLISVIMGVHNGAKRLEDSIRSIIAQSHENWEFIICDDGSCDGSYEKLKSQYGSDSRFKIIRNRTNLGLAATLNHCIEHCNGDFIARMDDDDISYPERFEQELKFLLQHPDISFISSSIDIYDGNKVVGLRKLKKYPQKIDLIWNSPFVHPTTMFRAADLREAGCYRVAPETGRGQDYDLFMRLYGMGYKGANLQEPVYRFTVDEMNLKRRTFKARIGEMKIRSHGYKKMGIMPWAALIILKPMVAHFFMGIRNKFWKRGY
jgi:glycosyltransferase involved in cell wall biosynthesis